MNQKLKAEQWHRKKEATFVVDCVRYKKWNPPCNA